MLVTTPKTVWLLWEQTILYGSTMTTREMTRPLTLDGIEDDSIPKWAYVRVQVPVSTEQLVGVYSEDPLAGRTDSRRYRSQRIEVREPEQAYLGEGI